MDISKIELPDRLREQLGVKTEDHARRKVGSILGRAKPEILEIAKALPHFAPISVLDIGCGLAAKTLLLALQYPSIGRIHLIDGDKLDGHGGGYQPITEAWGNVWQGRHFIEHNLLRYDREVVVTASLPRPAMPEAKWDLIVSFRACGHHFEVTPYIDLFRSELAKEGVIILDIRNNTPNEALMQRGGFTKLLEVPDSSKKCKRMVFKRG